MEVGGDGETLRQQSPLFLDERGKRGKEKIPKNQAPLADDAVRPSAWEAAFALGQSLADLGCLTLCEWANDEPPPGTARQE
jgi:hypothetical protein